ncbi:MAG: L,D-transpeptidase [Acidimicrobiales bacterium]
MAPHFEVIPDRRRPMAAALVVISGLLVAAGVVVITEDDPAPPAAAEPTASSSTTTEAPTTTTTSAPAPVVPVSTSLASPNGEIPTFDSPDGAAVGVVGIWYGYPMTMPIVEEQGDWLRIQLPERPNEATAWVRAADVTRSASPWRMVLTLSETRVRVYKDGFEVWSAPVGIGRDHTRTPTGSYFVAVIEEPGPAGYGPIVLNLNAHSEDIQSWQGSGDAITAFHGPFGSEELIRSGGGKVSNGCLRMLPEDQIKMEGITLGTPVDIVA